MSVGFMVHNTVKKSFLTEGVFYAGVVRPSQDETERNNKSTPESLRAQFPQSRNTTPINKGNTKPNPQFVDYFISKSREKQERNEMTRP